MNLRNKESLKNALKEVIPQIIVSDLHKYKAPITAMIRLSGKIHRRGRIVNTVTACNQIAQSCGITVTRADARDYSKLIPSELVS